MFQRIIVPLDGSERAEHAIPVALYLAHASGGKIVFVRAIRPPSNFGDYGEEEAIAVRPSAYEKRLINAEQYLLRVIHMYEKELAGLRVQHEVETGGAASAIFSLAAQEKGDLIVLNSHGAHHLLHWIFRSVAREAIQHSPVPILVLKETENTFLEALQHQPVRLLVPLDGSPFAEAALQPALQLLTTLASPERREMHLIRILELPSIEGKPILRANEIQHMQKRAMQEAETYLQGVAHRLSASLSRESQLEISWSVRVSSHVAQGIIEIGEQQAETEQANSSNLLVMATHGRSGMQRLRLGSVTEHVLGATNLPMLIVRPPWPSHQPVRNADQKPESILR